MARRQSEIERLKEDLQFKHDLRHWRGMALSFPDQEELDMADRLRELQDAQNRDDDRPLFTVNTER